MFHPVPFLRRFLIIVVLLSVNRGILSAQPGRRFQIQQGQIRNLPPDFRSPRPDTSKWLAPVMPPPPPMPTRVPIAAKRLDALVSDLESGNFQQRVSATRELKEKGGIGTVRRMSDAVLSDSPEVSMRALSVLEAIFLSEDHEANRAAEQALQQLARDRFDSLAMQANYILESHEQIRKKRAVSDLLSMGLEIEYSRDFYDVDDLTGELTPMISYIRLTRAWKGGEDGIVQIARLDNIRLIYVIDNCSVSRKRIEEILHPVMPNVRVEERGAAELGIQASIDQQSPGERGVRINMVAPGKAAHLGGIRANDLITHVEGLETPTFPDLVKRLKKFEPGDVIEVIVGRNGGPQDYRVLEIELKGWSSPD